MAQDAAGTAGARLSPQVDSLIRAAQAGDQDAFEQLVRTYDQSVLRLAMNLLRSPEDARDVYQEAFLRVYRNLHAFRFDCSCREKKVPADIVRLAEELVTAIRAGLPRLAQLLATDLEAALKNDPAASGLEEIMLSYPGTEAITVQRLAHELYNLKVPYLPRIMTELAHSRTGIDIHPGAQIGPSFFIDHGTGVVIGETAIIGERVRVYQAVTLGAKSFAADLDGTLVKGNARHPIVEDDVVIYAGATILGRVTIGRGSVIGGNVWLTHSVPPGSSVRQGKIREVERGDEGQLK